MAPKTATTTKASAPKPVAQHPTFQDMIKDAIVNLKDRQGSGRPSLKKYIRANNKNLPDEKQFDSLFNRALKNGVVKGVFEQPKGPSGGVKLAKAQAKPAAAKSAAKPSDKSATTKKAAPKPTEKKAATTKKPAAAKKTDAPKAKAASTKAAKPASDKVKTGRVAKPKAAAAAADKKKAAPAKKAAAAKPKAKTAKA